MEHLHGWCQQCHQCILPLSHFPLTPDFCAGMITVGTHTGDMIWLVSFSCILSACSLSPASPVVTQSVHLHFLFLPHVSISRFINMCRIPCCWMPSAAACCLKKNARLEVLHLSVQDAISPSADWSRLSCSWGLLQLFCCFLRFFPWLLTNCIVFVVENRTL